VKHHSRKSFSAETSRMRRRKAYTKGSSSSSKLSSQGQFESHSSSGSCSSSASPSSSSADDCGVPRSSEGAGAPKVHVRGRLSGGGDFAALLSVGAGDPRVGVRGRLGGTLVLCDLVVSAAGVALSSAKNLLGSSARTESTKSWRIDSSNSFWSNHPATRARSKASAS